MTDEELKKYLEEKEGYFNVRILPDGLIGCRKMMFTTGLFLDMDKFSYAGGRVCYPTTEQAIEACNLLNSIEDEPMEGFTADKRTINPHHSEK